jgi:hypothetical protein
MADISGLGLDSMVLLCPRSRDRFVSSIFECQATSRNMHTTRDATGFGQYERLQSQHYDIEHATAFESMAATVESAAYSSTSFRSHQDASSS